MIFLLIILNILLMSDYFVIKKFDECLPRIWDDFLFEFKRCMVMAYKNSIVAKTFGKIILIIVFL